MRPEDFDFNLPPELVAQTPAPRRDQSRLLVLHRDSGQMGHRRFADLLTYLRAGDVLVLNDSRVIPARLRGTNARSTGQFELLLLQENAPNDWWAMVRPGKRARIGTEIILRDPRGKPTEVRAQVRATKSEGHRRLLFSGTPNVASNLEQLGEIPLPPYIRRTGQRHSQLDRERYQTVFAKLPGSVAAPTAGLHFTEPLLAQAAALGVQICFLTLHVGLGTFAPVKTQTLAAHTMHQESYVVSQTTAQTINTAKRQGHRIFAVGTTTLRVLESVCLDEATGDTTGFVHAGTGKTRIFIHPPRAFAIVDALLTNFHLPRSTLLMLVSAFAAPGQTTGRQLILRAYTEAIREHYRFFSYGDAMLLL